MIAAFLEGLGLGFILSILAGPIFFTILQVGVERGGKPATVLAGGQWVSDFLYIALVSWGSKYIEVLNTDEASKQTFIQWMGSFGSVMLAIFGLAMLITKQSTKTLKLKSYSYPALFMKGFLINTINPTPIFFWMALMSSAIIKNYSFGATIVLFGTVMTIVIVTDLLKIYMAKRIRNWLNERYLIYIRRIAGIALLGFSAFLAVQVYLTF